MSEDKLDQLIEGVATSARMYGVLSDSCESYKRKLRDHVIELSGVLTEEELDNQLHLFCYGKQAYQVADEELRRVEQVLLRIRRSP